ncbi:MAG: hypothetical protein U0946_03100 [Patescibacteria group bacterium]|nr:hypothetical protein [Patescibacteria group bacterium]
MAGCEFNPVAEVKAFASYKNRLGSEYPDWSPEFLHKQALIVFNTEMYPLQVESYLAEKKGELSSSTGQVFQITDGLLVNKHYDFQNMINYADSQEEKESMIDFQNKAVAAKTGEKVFLLDMSALGRGEGIKYLDIYEKESDSLIRHKERIDLTKDGQDLTLDKAKEILGELENPEALMPYIEALQPLPEVWFTGPGPILIEPPIEPKKPLPVSDVGSFWFEAVAAPPSITETSLPTRSNLVSVSQTVGLEVGKPVIIKPEEKIKSLITAKQHGLEEAKAVVDLEPVGVEKIYTFDYDRGEKCQDIAADFEAGRVDVAVVEDRSYLPETALVSDILFRNGAEPKILEKPAVTLSVGEPAREEEIYTFDYDRGEKCQELKPTRLDLEGQAVEPKEMKAEAVIYQAPKRRGKVLVEKPIQPEEEIPIYQPRWEATAINDIPEWLWQGVAASPDEIIDWPWFLTTMLYALLNTKVLLRVKRN